MKSFVSILRRRAVRISISAVVLSLALTYATLRIRANWAAVREIQWDLDYRLLPVAVLIYGVNLLIFLFVWHRMLRRLHPGMRFRDDARRYALSNLPKYLPTVFWYVAGRVHLYELAGVRRSTTLIATLLEVALHAAAGAMLYSVIMLLTARAAWQQIAWGMLLLGILFLLSQPRVLGPTVERTGKWGRTLRTTVAAVGGSNLLRWCMAYLVTWFNGLPFFYAILWAFPAARSLGLVDLARIWCLVGIIDYLMTWTLGGLAFARDITLTGLLSQIIPLPVAIAVAAMVKLALMLNDFAWSGLVLLAVGRASGDDIRGVAPAYDLLGESE